MQHQLTMVEQTNAIEQLSPTSFSSSVSSDLSVINVKSISLSSETNTTPTASSSMPLIHNHSILAEQSSIGSIHPYNYHYATYVEQQQQQQHSSDENLPDQHEHRICYNCRTTHTPLWRRFGPNQFLCNACGLYQRVNGQHRPLVRNIRRLSTTNKRVGLICANCGTKATSMWRRNSSGDSVCNACGLYFRLNGINRPPAMRKETIRTRRRRNVKSNLMQPSTMRYFVEPNSLNIHDHMSSGSNSLPIRSISTIPETKPHTSITSVWTSDSSKASTSNQINESVSLGQQILPNELSPQSFHHQNLNSLHEYQIQSTRSNVSNGYILKTDFFGQNQSQYQSIINQSSNAFLSAYLQHQQVQKNGKIENDHLI